MTTPFNVSQNIEENLVLHSNFNLTGSQTIQQQGMTKPRRRRRRNGKGGETQLQLQLLGQKKRKLTAEQATLLEISFGNEQKLDTERKNKLAGELGLHPRQVAVWFQNRRARYKNKQLEEEYTSLKKAHDSAVLQKCALESEVSRLTEKLEETESEKQRMIQQQLAEMEKEIRKLTEGCGENSHNSPGPQLITIQTVGTAAAAAADVHDVVKDTPFLDEHYTPQPPYQRHQPEPNPSLVLEEQPHQYGSDVTDDGGGGDGDGIGIAYWTGIYQGFMMDNGSLWNDQYFHRL